MDVFTDRGSVFFKQPSSPGSVEGIRIYRGPTYEEFRARGFMYVHDDTEFFARFPVGTFADDTLPLTLPFDQATTSEFWFSRIPGGPLTRETLTDFSAAIVPEPHAALLAATALLPLARPRRPRRPRPGGK